MERILYELNDVKEDDIFDNYFWSKEDAIRAADDIRYYLTDAERKNRKIYIIAYNVDVGADIDADKFVDLLWKGEIECSQFDLNLGFADNKQVDYFELDLESGEWEF